MLNGLAFWISELQLADSLVKIRSEVNNVILKIFCRKGGKFFSAMIQNTVINAQKVIKALGVQKIASFLAENRRVS
jgi:hypothetical protein